MASFRGQEIFPKVSGVGPMFQDFNFGTTIQRLLQLESVHIWEKVNAGFRLTKEIISSVFGSPFRCSKYAVYCNRIIQWGT